MNADLIENYLVPAIKFMTLLGLVWSFTGFLQADSRLWQRIGIALVLVATLLELGLTVYRSTEEISLAAAWSYALTTRHGGFLLLRIAALMLLLLNWQGIKWVAAVAVILTLSLTSHLGANGQVLPILSDALHLSSMIVWLATLWGFLVLPQSHAMARVSQIGLWAVATLSITGLVQAVLRLWSPALLWETSYGLALLQKLGVVALVLLIAAANRWYFLPQINTNKSRLQPFRQVVWLESTALLGVLWLTSVLTNTSPPERGFRLLEPIALSGTQNVWTLAGQARALTVGGIRLDFSIMGSAGYALNKDSRVDIQLIPTAGAIRSVYVPPVYLGNNRFRAEAWLGEAGTFNLEIRLPGGAWTYPVEIVEP